MERVKFIFGEESYNRKVQERMIKMAFLFCQLKSETIRINSMDKKITSGIIDSYDYKIKIYYYEDFQKINDEINNIDVKINNIKEIDNSLQVIEKKMQILIDEVKDKYKGSDEVNQAIFILYLLNRIDDKLSKVEDSNDVKGNYKTYKKMRNINLSPNYKFKEYYLVNKAWIKKYKDYYNFTKISDELDKNSLVQNSFGNIISDNQNTNFNLKDKLVALIIKQLQKNIIDDFNNRDSNFATYYKNEEFQNPSLTHINYNGNNKLIYLYDFEIINAEIYDSLFKYMNINILIQEVENIVFNNDALSTKVEKVKCIFETELIIIQFPNKITEGKYLIEIGKLINNNIFESEYFLLYVQYNYLNEHVQNIINSNRIQNMIKIIS